MTHALLRRLVHEVASAIDGGWIPAAADIRAFCARWRVDPETFRRAFEHVTGATPEGLVGLVARRRLVLGRRRAEPPRLPPLPPPRVRPRRPPVTSEPQWPD